MGKIAKVKQVKKINGNTNKEEIDMASNVFDKIFGNNPILNPDIIHPRCISIKENLTVFVKILNILTTNVAIKDLCDNNDFLKEGYDDLNNYIKDLNNYINDVIVLPFELNEMKKKVLDVMDVMNDESYDNDKAKILTDLYRSIKDGEYINSSIELLKNLQPHKKYILDENNEYSKWLEDMPGLEYSIFPFSNLNIKFIYTYDFEDYNIKKFISLIIKKLYKNTNELYDIITELDFDISRFTDIIINNIDSLKKELPRCDDAFDVIVEALNQIKNNFKKFYKDFEYTQDPSVMIQNFMSDLYQENKNNPIVIAQLRKIISHFSNKIKSHSKVTPKVSNLIDNLNEISIKSTMDSDISTSDITHTLFETMKDNL